MEGNKCYTDSKEEILNTIYDIVELQNGQLLISDVIHGRILCKLSMYGNTWEFMYTVSATNGGKHNVNISVSGDHINKERELRRAFALLDSLLDNAPRGGGARHPHLGKVTAIH